MAQTDGARAVETALIQAIGPGLPTLQRAYDQGILTEVEDLRIKIEYNGGGMEARILATIAFDDDGDGTIEPEEHRVTASLPLTVRDETRLREVLDGLLSELQPDITIACNLQTASAREELRRRRQVAAQQAADEEAARLAAEDPAAAQQTSAAAFAAAAAEAAEMPADGE